MPTYDELILVARREDLDAAGASRLRRFLRDRRRRTGCCETNPTAGVDALLKADKGLDRGAAGGGDQGDAAGLLPGRHGAAVGLAGAGRLGQLRALDAREQAAQAAAVRGAAADQRVPAGRGPGIVRARMR